MSQQKATLVILFADVCKSTQLFERYGNVEARSLVSRTLSLAMDVTRQYGGTIIKTIGDEVMVTLPTPQQGVEAAGEIQRMVKQDPTLAVRNIALRIGLHYGPVLWENNDVYGDAVNVAARMAGVAQADQVIATRDTIQHLPAHLQADTRSLGPLRVKGKRQALEICECLWQEEGTGELTVFNIGGTASHKALGSLNCLQLTYAGQIYEITEAMPTFHIGREARNELAVTEPMASRIHAQIESRNGMFILTDRSTNGTFVQVEAGEKIYLHRNEAHLHDNGIISLGKDIDTEHNPETIYFRLL